MNPKQCSSARRVAGEEIEMHFGNYNFRGAYSDAERVPEIFKNWEIQIQKVDVG